MAEPDPLRELERQVERGHVFAHAVLGQHANRAGENEAIIRGLVELLGIPLLLASRRMHDPADTVERQVTVTTP